MENRPLAIGITVVTALCCGCFALMSCVWGIIGVSGAPITMTDTYGLETVESMPMPLALGLLCVSVIFIAIPVAVGFFTLRKKPTAQSAMVSDEPLPPTA
jgi:ABC-type glycerol-3-phosphate transport system permease component